MATTSGTTTGLRGINHKPLRDLIGTRCLNVPVFAVGAADANVDTTNAIDVCIDGLAYTAAALSNETATITSSDDGSTNQADNTTCWYIFALDTSGNVQVYKGADDETSKLPTMPEDVAPFALLKVVAASVGATFTMGTDAYNTSGITTTAYDCSVLPVAVPS